MKTRFTTLCAIACMFHFSFTLEAQGKVGIGTNNPIHPFQVNVDSIDSVVQPDQSTGSQNGFLPIVSGLGAGQTIVVGLTGELYEVDLALNYTGMSAGTLRLKIREGNTPSGMVLAQEDINVTSSTSTAYPIILTEPLPFVYTGDSLFFDVSYVSGGNLAWSKNSMNPYAPGIAYIYTGTWSMLSGDDMIFTTHVNLLDTTSIPVLQVTEEGRLALKNYSLPEVDGEEGQVMVTDGNGDVAWIDTDTLLTGFWRIGGNTGTNPSSNFIGTVDNQPLKFRIKNKQAGLIDSTRRATAIGFRAIDSLSTGIHNTALGYQAARGVKTTDGNTAIGSFALAGYGGSSGAAGEYNTAVGTVALGYQLNSGSYNTATGAFTMFNHNTGNYNSAFGYQALDFGNGNSNVAVGAQSMLSCSGDNNVAIGTLALIVNSGNANVAIGASALKNNYSYSSSFAKSYIVAVGDSALFTNGWESTDALHSIENTAIGSKALFSNTTGSYNTALGFNSLRSNVGGVENTAMGSYSMYNNNTGNNNVAAGTSTLYSNTSGKANVAIGLRALFSNTTRSNLVAIGDSAMFYNGIGATDMTHASQNTAVGAKALKANTKGWVNTALGSQSLLANTDGIGNTAVGANALLSNTLGGYNTAIGLNSLQLNTIGVNNTATGAAALQNNNGNNNSAHGMYGLYLNATGNDNTAVGFATLYSNTSGSFNTALGSGVLNYSTGDNNTASGAYALYSNTTGGENTAMGRDAMYQNLGGERNTVVGFEALKSSADSDWNTIVGYKAATAQASYVTGVFIGYQADASAITTNSGAIGYGAIVNANNKIRIGSGTVGVIEGQVDWTWPSDARFKFNIHDDAVPGLAFINRLRPVTYQFDTRRFDLHLMQNMPDSIQQRRMEGQDYTESTARIQTGFLAQEVEQICNDLGYTFSGLHVPESDVDNYGLAYGSFVPLLVKAVQEQQTQITSLESMNQSLTDRITILEMTVERLLRTED